jgi:hypothetical protein
MLLLLILILWIIAIASTHINNVTILMIGSINRTEFTDIQQIHLKTYLDKCENANLLIYNESLLSKCVVCNNESTKYAEKYRYANKPYGWWCAQKNLLLGLQHFLNNTINLPSFLYIADDDTYVNLPNLINLIETLNTSDSLYMGFLGYDRYYEQYHRYYGPHHNKTTLIYGGGGSLISRSVLQKLQLSISVCIANIQGGIWCHYHSDWSLANCIEIVANTTATSNRLFRQYSTTKNCHNNYISCHGFHNASTLDQIYISHESNSK